MGRTGISLLVPVQRIERRILFLRGHRVMLDVDLAEIYGVTTKRLNEQVKRNRGRFPEDFVFRLHRAEAVALNRSQTATGSQKHRDPRFRPYAFTEHGAVMLASVLNSPVAVRASILVVRAFVRLRQLALSHTEFARRLAALERRLSEHDVQFKGVVEAIRQLMEPSRPREGKGRIGFHLPKKGEGGGMQNPATRRSGRPLRVERRS